jgi:hypothetical protein
MTSNNYPLKASASATLVICDTFLINRSTRLFGQNKGETHSIDSLSDVTHCNTEAEGVAYYA